MAAATAVPADGVGLLEGAIGYALGSVTAVVPSFLSRPTPCADWDLRMLLQHVNESLTVLHEGLETGCIDPARCADDIDETAGGLVATFRGRASRLLGALPTADGQEQMIAIADLPLWAGIVAATGAIEIAVHGWDISRACGRREPIPPVLAVDILAISPLLVDGATRRLQFAAPVAVSPLASASDRLVAFLGRRPEA